MIKSSPQCYVWTIGCQMNKAESQRIVNALETFGYEFTHALRQADLVILNTCVVRQSAEDKVIGTLGYLKGLKDSRHNLVILVTGCFVNSEIDDLRRRFPHVDLFFNPGDLSQLLAWGKERGMSFYDERKAGRQHNHIEARAYVPVMQGCNNFCSYCIVPYRRGREKSRTTEQIVQEVEQLAYAGVKEVILLGQNVDSYGHDLPAQPDLSDLLCKVSAIDDLARIRFMTNHPRYMSRKIIEAVASLDKVCENICLPLQSGDDGILKAMRRGYTSEQYRQLIDNIRRRIPGVALSTDVIVGFPGETECQFTQTLCLLEEIKFDVVHVASYSPRPGTIAARDYVDDIPSDVKKDRFNRVESLQTKIAGEINSMFCGKKLEILVEGEKNGKWYGRTRGDKLVFFTRNSAYIRQLVDVRINKASPWALQGEIQEHTTDIMA